MDPQQRSTVRMRRTRTGAVLAGAAMVLAGGCTVAGSSAGSSYPALRPGGESSAAAAAVTEPASAALTGKDVPGHAVRKPSTGESVRAKDVETDSACRAVALALAGVATGQPASSTVRRATGGAAVTTVTLASYREGKDAEAVMTDVNQAADACAGGFQVALKGREQHVTKVVRELAPVGTDQAMAFGLTTERNGKQTPVKVIVLRKGATVCVLSAVPAGTVSPEAFAVPGEVIEAQLVKLS